MSTAETIDRIREGARINAKVSLEEVRSAALSYKPKGYDEKYRDLATLYENRQEELARQAIDKRFKHTGHKYTILPLNIIRRDAALDAQVYRQEPERWIEVNGERALLEMKDQHGNVIQEEHGDAPRLRRFKEVEKRARLPRVMPEWEQRTCAVGVCFARARVVRRPDRPKRSYIEIRLFWPHLVWAIDHNDHPGELAMALVVGLVLGNGVTEVWSRLPTPIVQQHRNEDGSTEDRTFYWRIEHISDAGETVLNKLYPLPDLPIWAMYAGMPQGTLWLDEKRDRVAQQNGVNVTIANWQQREDQQNHSQRWASGPGVEKMKGRKLVGGAGAFWPFPEGTTIGEFRPVLDETTLANLERVQKMLAGAERISPDAVATQPGPPISGVSRLVRNDASNQKRSEHVASFKQLEEEQLLEDLCRMADAFMPDVIGGQVFDRDDVTAHVRFPPPAQYEEPEAKRLTASNMMRDGWLSPRKAAVRGGAYRSEAEAALAGLSDERLPMQAEAPESRARSPQSEPPPEVVDDGDGDQIERRLAGLEALARRPPPPPPPAARRPRDPDDER